MVHSGLATHSQTLGVSASSQGPVSTIWDTHNWTGTLAHPKRTAEGHAGRAASHQPHKIPDYRAASARGAMSLGSASNRLSCDWPSPHHAPGYVPGAQCRLLARKQTSPLQHRQVHAWKLVGTFISTTLTSKTRDRRPKCKLPVCTYAGVHRSRRVLYIPDTFVYLDHCFVGAVAVSVLYWCL